MRDKNTYLLNKENQALYAGLKGEYKIYAWQLLNALFVRCKPQSAINASLSDIFSMLSEAQAAGQPFSQLPASRFHERNPQTGVYDTEQESADIVRALIRLMGLAAAENIILKKYMPDGSCRFAEGKEIIEFGYDVHFRKEMPLRIHLCSIRGTLGWPDRSRTQENLRTIANYYLNTFARVTWKYAQNHPIIEPWDLADAFWEGFAARTHEIAWNYTVQRKEFDHFRPRIFGDFKFQEKWEFALWALERQNEQISDFSEIFHDIFRRLLESGGDGNSLSLMDVIAVDDDMLEELDTRDACEKVRQCVQTCLSPRERKIITLRYGLGGQAPHTQREIAAQCGISRSYVSQRR